MERKKIIKKKVISILLVMALTISLFSNYIISKIKNVEAAGSLQSVCDYAIQICNDDSHGYGASWPDVVCTQLVRRAFESAGISFPSTDWCPNYPSALPRYGFTYYSSSQMHLGNSSQLQPGDILWRSGHVALYVGNGKIAEASDNAPSKNNPYRNPRPGDQGNEVWVHNYYNISPYWSGVFRYKGGVIPPNPNPNPNPSILKNGSRGSFVSDLQSKLNLVINAGLAVDGVFGNATRNAVISFQRAFGLSVDGQVGNQTWGKLNSEWQARQVVYPTGVNISAGSMDLTVGYSKQLSASINPGNATNKSITWSSSNGNIASVDGNGRVTGKSKGTVNITASSSNGKTATCKVTVYNPVYVSFVNYDDSELSKVKLEYGGTAKAPENPERRGYKFTGWDGVYQNVKSDAVVKAQYTKLNYKVEFKETDGTSIMAAQSIPFQEAAAAPDESLLHIPSGYLFTGWSDSFDSIENDMTIYPVYKWKDGELPMVVEADENACTANYDEGIYTVKFNLKNHSSKMRNARVMIYMMTDGGKMVAQGETRTVKVPAGKVKETEAGSPKKLAMMKTPEVVEEEVEDTSDDIHSPSDAELEDTNEVSEKMSLKKIATQSVDNSDEETEEIIEDGVVEIDDLYVICKSPADKARILVLDDYESAVPLAEIADIPVASAGYGEWQDEQKESDAPVEKRTVYRSKAVNYTTSNTASSIEGWTKYNTTSKTTRNNDRRSNGSGSSANAPGVAGAYRVWAEREGYNYGGNIEPTYTITISSTGGDTYRSMVRWIQEGLNKCGIGTAVDGVYGSNTRAAVMTFQRSYGLSADGQFGPASRAKMKEVVNSRLVYYYFYETQTTTYTYYYYQAAADWSEWTAETIEGDSVINPGTTKVLVESKQQFRYKENVVETTGTLMKPECKLPDEAKNLAGKNAVVIVFKNKVNQIAEDNVEYIGDTTIGTDGKLNISFIPREEISYENTGDYTIVLGVKGTTNYVKVGTIEAPKPKYNITFVDMEGNKIVSQEIEEGHDAEAPEAPELEGYTFTGWDTGITNIHDNLTVKAMYDRKSCRVTFVDWENKSIDVKEYAYGDRLIYPETPEAPIDKEFDKWSINENAEITEDVVCEALYKDREFNIKFVDYRGEVVEEVNVPYGASVLTPLVLKEEEVEPEDIYVPVSEEVEDEDGNKTGEVVYFDSWGEDLDLSYITSNIVVGAIYKFDETVSKPVASVTTGEYDSTQKVTLSSETEDSIIYYTTDGSDPTDVKNNAVKTYTSPITISDKTVLKFYATKMSYNDSDVAEEWYATNTPGNVPTHVVNIQAFCDFEYLETPSGYKGFIEDGSSVSVNDILLDNYETIELRGLYYDLEDMDKWQENDLITESVTLYAVYGPKELEVNYVDENGNIVATGKTLYGTEVNTELVPSKEGFHFAGFSSDDDYTCVTKDITVTVHYIDDSKYVVIKFPRNSYSIMEGATYKLAPKVTYESDGTKAMGETIIYSSSDEETAQVDDMGNVTALKKGEVTITAKVESSGTVAECIIKIVGNPDTSIVLYSNSNYKIDSGYLRNIDIEKNTVSEIRKQINADSDKLLFLNTDEEMLEESVKAGTGTIIRLIDDDNKIADALKIIIIGDYNGDGNISSMDVSGVARALLGKETAEQEQLVAVDVNGDGNVNNRDAAMIARYLVGKEKLGNE